MNAIDVLKENVILKEAFLLSYGNPDRRIGDLALQIQISEWNFTKKFFADWGIPADHTMAYKRIQDLFKGDRLQVICRNVARLQIDRVGRNPELLLADTVAPTADAWLGPLTIFGSGFKTESETLNSLGEHKRGFFHWTLHLVDGRIDIVARQLELPNFPDV